MLPLKDTVQSRSYPLVNWALIAINVFVFFFLLTLGPLADAYVRVLGLVPARFLNNLNLFEFQTLFSSMFLHGGWVHLVSNMLALYIFGDNVEDRMGSARYLLFYLLCGLIAAFVHIAFNQDSLIPTVGASGAISGVLAAYFVLFPTARVITLVPMFFLPWFVEIPAVFYLGFWFVSQLFNGVLTVMTGAQAFGGVAWWAHIGGFLAGLVLVRLFVYRRYVRRVYVDEYFPW